MVLAVRLQLNTVPAAQSLDFPYAAPKPPPKLYWTWDNVSPFMVNPSLAHAYSFASTLYLWFDGGVIMLHPCSSGNSLQKWFDLGLEASAGARKLR